MSVYEEDKKRYILGRSGLEDGEDLATIDTYSGNIYWNSNLDDCTKFEKKEECEELLKLQEGMSKLLKKDWEFEILEEHRVVNRLTKES